MNYLNDLWRQCGSPWAPGMLALQDAYFVTLVDAGWCDEGGNVHATRPRWRRRLLGPDEEYHEPEEWPPRWHGGGGGSGAATPDWSDAATVGCLLGMVREEWGEPTASAQLTPNGEWGVWFRTGEWCYSTIYESSRSRRRGLIDATTEAEALLRALLAAKERR